jgi:hypothetical protein
LSVICNSIQIISGEGGIRTLSLSAFIFKMLSSDDGAGAPNFPPHDLGEFDELKIVTFKEIGKLSSHIRSPSIVRRHGLVRQLLDPVP